MFHTIVSVIIMLLSGLVGLYVGGAALHDMVGGGVLFVLVSGFACVIHAIERKGKKEDGEKKG